MGDRTSVITTPLSYRVDDAATMLGIGKSKVWELISTGRLGARKIDGATVILHSALVDFLDASPQAEARYTAQASIK